MTVLTRGEKVIRFIESYCVIPEGQHVGKPVKLAEFQIRFIIEVYDNPHVTDTAILSIARKNAKTGTIAFLLLAHLVGPEAVQNSRIVSGAMSRDQAAEVYNLASKCVQLSPKLRDIVKPIPSKKALHGLPMNVEYNAISADAHTAHGKSPLVAILDEVGRIQGPQSDFVDAITTAQGAYDTPLLFYISTQAPTDADFFSIQIDDAKKNKPDKTVCHVYAADPEADVDDESAWKAANPALGLFRSEADVRKQAEKAKRMPSFENTFRNLVLNQRVSVFSPFVSPNTWRKAAGSVTYDDFYGLDVCIGLDLSSRNDLTALAIVGEQDGRKLCRVEFFAPKEGVKDRAKRDRAPYDEWAEAGYISLTPGASVDYSYLAERLIQICQDLNVSAIAFDRWRIDVLKKEISREGLELPLVPFGQGFKDMSPAVDTLESDLLQGRLVHDNNPVMNMCATNAVVIKDPAGNRKLDKSKSTARIDGMVALSMAVGRAAVSEQLSDSIYNHTSL